MENTTISIILANACHSIRVSATFFISFFSTLVFIAITFLYRFFKSRFQGNENLKKCSLPPGPKPWPIVGSLPEMLRNKPTFRWIHELMNDMNTKIACIRLGCVHVIAVSCPEISREFLKKQDALFASRPISMSTEMTTKGYLSAILVPFGEQWKKMKKIVTMEVVSPARHLLFHATRIEEADHLIRYVYNQCKNNYEYGGLVNVRVASQQYCGNVIRKMVFNKRFFGKGMADGGPGLEEVEHMHALFTVLQYLNSFCVTDYVPFLRWKLDLDGHENVMKKAIGIIEKYHDPLIEERVRQWRDGLKKDAEDVLDILITLKDGNGNPLLSTKEVTAQITHSRATVDSGEASVTSQQAWAAAQVYCSPRIPTSYLVESDNIPQNAPQSLATWSVAPESIKDEIHAFTSEMTQFATVVACCLTLIPFDSGTFASLVGPFPYEKVSCLSCTLDNE
ncbi:hypothetical protein JRO89_XS09G0015900 [Xanthoceras sorbifolium]|uniref:Cytochrome P450 n=1 Tax=Xanthoceras sorbifolium TaxID=99658 RepID=A0ABQ8HK98_9ROSI|nr:hypothetical protein JRO89_XS09G0015900 [Xanthoceras sorbifolium]